MTFSILARDKTGAIGIAICSSSPAVAARCVHLADGVGGVSSQNVTDPRLGPILLDLLRDGHSAHGALEAVKKHKDHKQYIEYRQLLIVDTFGRAGAYSGNRSLGVSSDAIGDGVVAGGNLLAMARIPQIMVDAFCEAPGDLEWRLHAAVRSANNAGGEAGPIHSAGISVIRDAGWRVTDLRVDWTEANPIDDLEKLLAVWMPQRDNYVTRGLDPTSAPSYGVLGDA